MSIFSRTQGRVNIDETNGGIEIEVTGSAAQPAYSFEADPDTGMYRVAADTLGFSTSGTQRVKITDVGDVVVGADVSGDALLHIASSDSGAIVNDPNNILVIEGASPRFTIGSTAGTSGLIAFADPDSDSVGSLVYAHSSDSFLLIADNSPRLTISPSSITATEPFLGETSGGASNPAYSFTGDTDTGMYRIDTNRLGFSTGGAERARISDTGQITVGDSTNANLVESDLVVTGNSMVIRGSNTGRAWHLASDSDQFLIGYGATKTSNETLRIDASGNLLPGANNTQNIGSATLNWDTIHANLFEGEATTATYADLAERYEIDTPVEKGTVVIFGGEKEITESSMANDHRIAGVISTEPAFMMNKNAGADETHPYLALTGRVPCKVIGPVEKGDILVTSNTPGYATVNNFAAPGRILGKALEATDIEGTTVIEVLVNLM